MSRHGVAIAVGGIALGVLSLGLSTWAFVYTADGGPSNGSLRTTGSIIWRYVHNQEPGVEWIALSDYGHDLVQPGGGLLEVPAWARPSGERPLQGTLRVGTLRAGWPRPWFVVRWTTNRGDVLFPPYPFDEDLGYGLDDAINHLFRRKGNPAYSLDWTAMVVDCLAWSIPWWIVLAIFSSPRGEKRDDELHEEEEPHGKASKGEEDLRGHDQNPPPEAVD